MPIRDGEAYYPETLGPDRSHSGGGQTYLESISTRLRGDETVDDLDRYFTDLAEWVEQRWMKAKIGNKHGEIQTVVDWMNLVGRYLKMPKRYYIVSRKEIRPILTGQEPIEDCMRLAVETCAILEGWYKNQHGTPMEHQWFVNTITLALRLLDHSQRVDTPDRVRDDPRRVRVVRRQPKGSC